MKPLFFLLLIAPLGGQTLGGFEPFTQQDNGESWIFYDYANEEAIDAPWNFSNSGDPEIYAPFTLDFGVSLFANVMSSNGFFVGSYADAGINTIICDVFIEDINSFSDVEFYILAGGTFYYSDFYVIEQSGWVGLQNSFSKDQWYFFDDDDREFIEVDLTPAILSDVSEIGLNFYPVLGLTDEEGNPILDGDGNQIFPGDGRVVALDNFTLLPDLTAPEVAVSTHPPSAKITFTGIEGMEYTIQTASNLRANSWTNVGSPFEIVGESSTNVPMTNRGFFRILSQPFYVEAP